MTEDNKTSGGFSVSHVIIIILVLALVWVIWSNYDQVPKPEPAADQGAAVAQSLSDTELPPAVDANAVEAEIDSLLAQFSKAILFPADERPQLATIENATTLTTENRFFSGSQDGDKVLIYTEAQKAYILSPARNLVVNVGPIVDESASEVE